MSDVEVHGMNMQEEETSSIHGDLLEAVFAHVPLIDLARACRVSKSWDYAVSSSLMHFKRVKPWLIIQTQSTRSPAKKTLHAYDPRSDTWVELSQPLAPSKHISTLHASSSTLIYELSTKELSFSIDPLCQTWYHISSPNTWRVEPIVALVGHHIIVAGGASGFLEDPLTVEMYDMKTSNWSTCQSMPDILKDSAASTWLSVASNQNKLYITEKASGITYSFSPQTKTWSGPYDLRADPHVFFSAIGFTGDDLILAGLIGYAQDVKSLKLWKIKPELMEINEISEIPLELLEKLKGEDGDLSSISLLATKDFIYMYKSSDPAHIIFCEHVEGEYKWGSVKNVLNDQARVGERMVMSCSRVSIADLHTATKTGNCTFLVKTNV